LCFRKYGLDIFNIVLIQIKPISLDLRQGFHIFSGLVHRSEHGHLAISMSDDAFQKWIVESILRVEAKVDGLLESKARVSILWVVVVLIVAELIRRGFQ